jgi:acyl dehydratase
MENKMRYFEDFQVGEKHRHGAHLLTKESLIGFAREYDPQPFHLDEEAAKKSYVKTLIGSGWQSCALMMKLMFEGFIKNAASFGAPGIEELKWANPTRPGDILSLEWEVVDKREMSSRPEMGMVKIRYLLKNQRDEIIIDAINWGFMGKRGAPPPKALPSDEGRALVQFEAASPLTFSTGFDDLKIGLSRVIGSHHFTREEIIRFATEYDPQPFHLSDEAAQNSYFGRLAASGWNTGSAFMKTMVAARMQAIKEAYKLGQKVPEWGPAAGFKNLKWSRPVYVGDTVTYINEVADKRVSNSKPDWGLLAFCNKGYNQYGDQVFEFTGTVLIKR